MEIKEQIFCRLANQRGNDEYLIKIKVHWRKRVWENAQPLDEPLCYDLEFMSKNIGWQNLPGLTLFLELNSNPLLNLLYSMDIVNKILWKSILIYTTSDHFNKVNGPYESLTYCLIYCDPKVNQKRSAGSKPLLACLWNTALDARPKLPLRYTHC